ncbi:cell division protein FtsQ/DivIB [Gordonia humi]|uniref:cell division protein FtsQ/DivIB n=1 Tax=Gordonia humi TaxID=686429 RepID=UPI0036116BCA
MTDRRAGHDRRRRPSRATVIVVAVLIVVAVGGATAIAYFTPLMSVRNVDVVGTRVVDRNDVIATAQAPTGTPLLQVDTGAIADRVAAIPAVEQVTVERSYPSTLTIDVTERTPLVTVDHDGQIGVMDRLGVVYERFDDRKSLPADAAALPALVTDRPGTGDPTTMAVLTVAQDLPGWLRERTVSIEASSPADITLALKSGRRAVWGDAERTADKAEALREVLKVKADEFNVSSPSSRP